MGTLGDAVVTAVSSEGTVALLLFAGLVVVGGLWALERKAKERLQEKLDLLRVEQIDDLRKSANLAEATNSSLQEIKAQMRAANPPALASGDLLMLLQQAATRKTE